MGCDLLVQAVRGQQFVCLFHFIFIAMCNTQVLSCLKVIQNTVHQTDEPAAVILERLVPFPALIGA